MQSRTVLDGTPKVMKIPRMSTFYQDFIRFLSTRHRHPSPLARWQQRAQNSRYGMHRQSSPTFRKHEDNIFLFSHFRSDNDLLATQELLFYQKPKPGPRANFQTYHTSQFFLREFQILHLNSSSVSRHQVPDKTNTYVVPHAQPQVQGADAGDIRVRSTSRERGQGSSCSCVRSGACRPSPSSPRAQLRPDLHIQKIN